MGNRKTKVVEKHFKEEDESGACKPPRPNITLDMHGENRLARQNFV